MSSVSSKPYVYESYWQHSPSSKCVFFFYLSFNLFSFQPILLEAALKEVEELKKQNCGALKQLGVKDFYIQ